MKKLLEVLVGSFLIQSLVTLIIYGFYASVIGVSLVPSVYLVWRAWATLSPVPTLFSVLSFSLACGGAIFLYFITGTLVMGVIVRTFTFGIKPGTYPKTSLTMVRWMIYSGVYHLAGMTILAYVPMSFLGIVFFKLLGAKIGKNVQLNTWFLNDAYLMEIGNDCIIGGKTDLSCHSFENDKLILQPIKIGDNTFIGQRCYISPGVTIGNRCLIGQYAFVRKNRTIPDGTVISAIAGLPIREVTKIENMRKTQKQGNGQTSET